MNHCVFCLKIGKQSSTEHILPAGFGSFENALTLPSSSGLVCKDCNEKFGRTIDRVFQRNTPEGHKRLDKTGQISSLRPDYLVDARYFIKHSQGLNIYIDAEKFLKGGKAEALTQLILISNEGNRENILGVDSIEGLDFSKYRKKYFQIIAGPNKNRTGPNLEAADKIFKLLIKKGFSDKNVTKTTVEPEPPKKLEVYVDATYTNEAMRGLIKICYGFLVHECLYKNNIKDIDVYGEKFKFIREFINQGKGAPEIKGGLGMLGNENESTKTSTGSAALLILDINNGKCIVGLRFYDGTSFHITVAQGLNSKIKYAGGYNYGSKETPQKVEKLYRKQSNLTLVTYTMDKFGRVGIKLIK